MIDWTIQALTWITAGVIAILIAAIILVGCEDPRP